MKKPLSYPKDKVWKIAGSYSASRFFQNISFFKQNKTVLCFEYRNGQKNLWDDFKDFEIESKYQAQQSKGAYWVHYDVNYKSMDALSELSNEVQFEYQQLNVLVYNEVGMVIINAPNFCNDTMFVEQNCSKIVVRAFLEQASGEFSLVYRN